MIYGLSLYKVLDKYRTLYYAMGMLTGKTENTIPTVPAYNVTDAARVLGVSTPTVYQWIADGLLEEMRLASGRTRLVSQESVMRLKAEREERKAVSA